MKLELPKKKKTKLEEDMEALQNEMNLEDGATKYMDQLDQLERMNQVNNALKGKAEKAQKRPIDWNTVLIVAGSILEVVYISYKEEIHSFTGKAFGMILRPKI